MADINLVPGGSAGPDTDFQFFPITVIFESSSIPRFCQSISVSEDMIIEDEENFSLSLSTIFRVVVISGGDTEVVIGDSTRSTILYLNSTELVITEGSSALLCFENTVELDREITFRIEFGFIQGI